MSLRTRLAGTRTGTMYETCERLFAVGRRLVSPSDRCSDTMMALLAPDNSSVYSISFTRGRHGSYALFPVEGIAGHGSFMFRDGTFEQHGVISMDDAERIITTFIPAWHEAYDRAAADRRNSQ